jgi:hypothetical protein
MISPVQLTGERVGGALAPRYFLVASGGTSTSQGHGSENFTLLLPFFTI